MKLTNEQLKEIYFGAYRFEETEDGYLKAFQHTNNQMEYFKKKDLFFYERSDASTSKTLEFTTKATKVSFDYKIIWKGSEDSIEAWVNGLAHEVKYIKDLKDEGVIEFNLPEGEKKVIIYLPADATALIKNFEINDEYTKANKGEKVLWLGDSITQGFGPLRSAHTYVSVANRLLNYDIINQGIGGYVYDKNSLEIMDGYMPDKIIIALGTNQYGTETMTDIEEYYEVLTDLYKGIPMLAITPLWRGDNMEGVPTLIRFCDRLKDIIKKYPQIKMVDGFTIVPHISEYYLDDLHPNQLGAEIYGRSLVDEIRRLEF